MELSKWIKRLRREATANPKKAAVLGLLLVVALYFWAPLLRGWIGKKDLSEKDIAVAPASKGENAFPLRAQETTTNKPAQEAAVHTWEEWDQWITRDPRTKAVKDLPVHRDPFLPVRKVVQEKTEKPLTPKRIEPTRIAVTPASLSMQLSSTVVGPSPRLAVINGKVYREGEVISLNKDGRKVAFTLTQVRARQVILSSPDGRFELNLPERKRSGRLELSSSQ